MWILDASVLIALGHQHALDLLTLLDEIAVPSQVRDEVTQEPEATNLTTFIADTDVHTEVPTDATIEHARTVLNDEQVTGDAAVIASVIAATDEGIDIGLVSDDQRIRAVSEGLGADVVGTIGIIVDAVRQAQFTAEAAKQLIRNLGDLALRNGVHRAPGGPARRPEMKTSSLDSPG